MLIENYGVDISDITPPANLNQYHHLTAETILSPLIDSGAKLGENELSILRKTGIQAGRALSIGDEVRDLKSSRQAGIDFGAATWGYNTVERLQEHKPEMIFTEPLQILEALNLPAV